MRLIDIDKITDDEIAKHLGVRYASCLEDVRDMLENQPTLDEKEIIRKPFERVVERLSERVGELIDLSYKSISVNPIIVKEYMDESLGVAEAIKIVKEECGISE